MDFTGMTISFLGLLKSFAGSWGLAIILLTIIVRACLWPSSVSQQRSMRSMQLLQPKMKAIQERYKSNPQLMQQKMMEFYKEHKFNPMAGCLPLLIQLPIFIMLYSALMSPQFIQQAGDAGFLFVQRLDSTIKSTAGQSFDGKFTAGPNDRFIAGKTAKVFFKDNSEPQNVKIDQPMKAISVQGDITPGKNIDLKTNSDRLNLSFDKIAQIDHVEIPVINSSTRENENISFAPKGENLLVASVETEMLKNSLHYDVVVLVLLFILTMWISQKIMMSTQKTSQMDAAQQAMQKSMGTFMPIMIGLTFLFIPIPAGVLLYLVTSNLFQITQTVIINKQLEAEDNKKTNSSANTTATTEEKAGAIEVEVKEPEENK